MQKWICDIFREPAADDPNALADQQVKIGEVHARIQISVSLVMKGAALLKRELGECLMASGLEREELARTLLYLDARMDWAIALMSEAYMKGSLRRAQIDEAYRLFALGQDVGLERESQRAMLMEWLQSVLFRLFDESSPSELSPISSSPFGLWFLHRGGLIFQGMPSIETVHDGLNKIDGTLLPAIAKAKAAGNGELSKLLGELKATVEEIKFLLGDLFQSVTKIEAGRDPMTRALNRRFLPTILSREIAIAHQTGTPFAVLMVDMDHFKKINDSWGHSAGDLALQQAVDVIMETVRLNDFIFRFGGEEFLVILVETGLDDAYAIAERVRIQLSGRELRLPNGAHFKVTASIGVALYEGQPDYTRLIETADQALYKAKETGRNRTVVAGHPEMSAA